MSTEVELYQQLILDHNRSPKNFRTLDTPTHRAEGFNPICGDHLWIDIQTDNNGTIADLAFQGEGCAISKASASIMTEILKGKTLDEVEKILSSVTKILNDGNEKSLTKDLRKLRVFSTISKYPARVKCANLAWYTLKSALNSKKIVSTE